MIAKRVLIVDDEGFVVRMIEDMLREGEIEALSAFSGEEAIEKARAEQPDLVLLDWMMPGMSGLEACRVLKKDPRTARIPIVMLTAKGQLRDEEEAKRAGAIDYLTKPFSPRKLLQLIEGYLGL